MTLQTLKITKSGMECAGILSIENNIRDKSTELGNINIHVHIIGDTSS